MKLLFVIMLGLLGIVTVSAQENNLTKPPFEYVVLKSGRVVSPNVTVTQDLEITSKKVAIPIFEDEDIRFRFTSDVELGEKQVETLLAKGVCAFGEKHHDTELTSELFYLNIQSDVVVELAEQEDGTFHAGRSLSETSRSSWVRGKFILLCLVTMLGIVLALRLLFQFIKRVLWKEEMGITWEIVIVLTTGCLIYYSDVLHYWRWFIGIPAVVLIVLLAAVVILPARCTSAEKSPA